MAPTRRMAESLGWGRSPRRVHRRLISLLMSSRGLVDQIFCHRGLGGTRRRPAPRCLASAISAATLGNRATELGGDFVPVLRRRLLGSRLSEDHC